MYLIDFVTIIKLNTNEPETHISHKPRYKFVTQTMLNTNKPKTHLSHKPRYEFVAKTMPNTNEPETHIYNIHFTQKNIITITRYLKWVYLGIK